MGKPNQKHKKAAVKSLRQRPAAAPSAAEEAIDVSVSLRSEAAQQHEGRSLPPCVQQLRESTDYAVLEEACADVALFALQPRHNATLLTAGVPQRLTQLLLFTSPLSPASEQSSASVHKAILYVQIAAADALRSLITNSEHDCVVDALTAAGVVDPASGQSFAEGLAALVRRDWALVQEARRRMTPQDWMDVYQENDEGNDDDDDDGEDAAANGTHAAKPDGQPAANGEESGVPSTARHRRHGGTRNDYFTLLRHLEEAVALAAVCVEASEACAAALAEPAVLCLLLDVLRVSTTTTWETILHPSAQYYAPGESDGAAPTVGETVLAMRAYKRKEACLLASLAVAVADALLLLSPDCPTLAQVLTSSSSSSVPTTAAAAVGGRDHGPNPSSLSTLTPEQRSFLNTAVEAVDLRAWLAEKPDAATQLQETLTDAALPMFVGPQHTVAALERERVLYNLLRATLAIQGMLLHVAPAAANIQRVLPLLCDALQKVSLPMRVWCGVLPVLMDTCEVADEALKASTTTLATHRLRSTQAAVRLLQVVVNVVCEKNDERLSASQDDEAAFAANPLAALLQSGSLFFAFGLLLKDVLWISQSSGGAEGGPRDVMAQQREQQQLRALRAEAHANAAATELQMVLLSTEVSVWEVASTLLLMLPVASLGDPSLTWRALMQAVQHRYQLHLDAAAATAAADEQQQLLSPGQAPLMNIVQHSASAHQLVWLQLESLAQMLWTMQRKQSKAHGGALAAANDVHATAADVDLLVRASWESPASAALKQACVGTVGLLCASLQHPDAITTATRFALAVAAHGGPAATFQLKLSDAFTSLVSATVPTYPAERRLWMQQLALVDAAATVRSEAANTLVDLFLDERYDASVYWPLAVQEGLKVFKTQLGAYVKRRLQLDKETKRKFHLSTETAEAEQWLEVLENLDGFLDYKLSNKGK